MLVAIGLVGCLDTTSAFTIDAPTYYSDHVTVFDLTGSAPRDVIDSLLTRVEFEWTQVTDFLPEFDPPDSAVIKILPGYGNASVDPGAKELTMFAHGRQGEGLSFDYLVHQLVHLWTGYLRIPFLEEGIAVYATEVLVAQSTTVHPYRGQPPHAWVAKFAERATVIPLDSALFWINFGFSLTGSTADATSWQIFVQSGSFTRWVVETFGRDTWADLFDTQDIESELGDTIPALDARWLADVWAAFPDPFDCREALEPYGERQAYWCMQAEG